ncbi:hypothetical protein O3P69_007664 [Scylla paramamosain]|uniref:Uncharacterized protein n=1 Tax=Scylla paramamosain TaxID=85552 RepID=A0AAW0UWZ2_SCYPA
MFGVGGSSEGARRDGKVMERGGKWREEDGNGRDRQERDRKTGEAEARARGWRSRREGRCEEAGKCGALRGKRHVTDRVTESNRGRGEARVAVALGRDIEGLNETCDLVCPRKHLSSHTSCPSSTHPHSPAPANLSSLEWLAGGTGAGRGGSSGDGGTEECVEEAVRSVEEPEGGACLWVFKGVRESIMGPRKGGE